MTTPYGTGQQGWDPQQGPYPHAGPPMPRQRPGVLTGAAVVGFVAAGIEIVGGIVWLAGGAFIDSLEDATESLGGESDGVGGLLVLLGLAFLVAGGFYIWGGLSALSGRSNRVLFFVAAASALSNLIGIIVSEASGGWLGFLLALVVGGLALAPPSRAFVRESGGNVI